MKKAEQSERFTTLSPILDNDRGKQTDYPGFNGDVPPNDVGLVPRENDNGKK